MKKKLFVLPVIFCMILSSFLLLSSANETSSLGEDKEYYDLAIITREQFMDEFQVLAVHKNTVGIKTLIKSTEEIYIEYDGVDAAEQIKYFIKDAKETYGISYVLLAGNESIIPIRKSNLDDGVEESFPSDLYYADIYNETGGFSSWDSNGNGVFAEWKFSSKDILDLYPDVYLGRIPCSNQSEVETSIYKIITYEKTSAGEWFDKVLLCGGDTCIAEDAYNEGECINDEIISILGTESYSFVKLWASIGNLSVANITSKINDGVGFVDFSGFSSGNSTSWMTHPHNDSESYLPIGGYTTNDAFSLSNNEKLPVIILGGSYCSDIGSDTPTLSDAFLFHDDGGSIGVFGSTAATFYYCSEDYVDGLFGYLETSLFSNYKNENIESLGELWSATITDYINNFPVMSDTIDCKTVEEFILLGDPSLRIGGYNMDYSVHNLVSGEDFHSIQGAIDDNDTQPGDTILVDSGVYYEHILIDKPLNLVGEDKNSTIIDAQHTGSVINVTSSNVTISKFTLKNTGNVSEMSGYDDSGITFWNMPADLVKNCTVHHNNFVDCFMGITLQYTENITIHNNSFSLVNYDYSRGINAEATDNSIISRNLAFNCTDGMYIGYDSDDNIISHNYIINNSRHGIKLYSGSNHAHNLIEYNTVKGNGEYGIYLDTAKNNSILHNQVSDNLWGIALTYHSQYNTIAGNTVINHSRGIYLLYSSSMNTVSENYVSENDNGIWLYSSSNNDIFENNIISNVRGIKLSSYCQFNSISNNLIQHNYFSLSLQTSNTNNTIYHNIILNATNPPYDDGSNQWDNGYPSGGNYWDDCTGIDSDDDGIGDTPYNISGGDNQDRYPLMNPITDPPIFVWVDDDFNSSMAGWNYTHFNNIENGINAVAEYGIVFVFNGTYYEVITVNKPLNLTGENRDTTIIDGGYGLNVIHMASGNSTINNFTILNCVDGIDLRADDCIIDNNKIMQATNGIRIHESYNNIISNNTISNNTDGISVVSSDNNTIIENKIQYNNDDGIRLYDSTNNLITLNTISNNQLSGIEISLSTNNNTIYHNNFINNNPNAFSSDVNINIWDNGYPAGGNYWDDYIGTDDDGDGIGDIPYNISGGNNQDHYPFTHPFGWIIIEDICQIVSDRPFLVRHASDGDWGGAQNVTPTVSTLTHIELYLKKLGTPDFDLTVELREDSIDGTLLDTIILTPGEFSSDWEWIELDFEDVSVTPDTDYFIVLAPPPSGMTNTFGYGWGYSLGDTIDDSSLWFTRTSGSFWLDLPDLYDYTFRTYGYN